MIGKFKSKNLFSQILFLSLLLLSISSQTNEKKQPKKTPHHKTSNLPLEEQIDFACSVFSGKVEEVLRSLFGESEAIILKDYEVIKSSYFHKFSKPKTLEISGFSGKHLKKMKTPKQDDFVMVFVCPNFKKKSWKSRGRYKKWHKRYWKMNRYVKRAGLVYVDKDEKNLNEARKIAWDKYHGKWYGKNKFVCRHRK